MIIKLLKKVDIIIEKIKLFEPKTGYYVAFSGGKDSIVILDLIKKADVSYSAHNSITSIDHPCVTKFIREEYPEVIRHKPEYTMFKLVEMHKALPTRLLRFCCKHLKENYGKGRVVVTGVRRDESIARKDRGFFSYNEEDTKLIINPIIDWVDWEVWQYIKHFNLKYPSIYDTGVKRVGCIGCPFLSVESKKADFEKYPNMKKNYLRVLKKIMDTGSYKNFKEVGLDENDVFEWWISNKSVEQYIKDKKY